MNIMPTLPTMEQTTLVTLMKFNTIDEATVAKSILDGAGIYSIIRNEYMASILPFGEGLAAEIMVSEQDAKEASAVLAAFNRQPDDAKSK